MRSLLLILIVCFAGECFAQEKNAGTTDQGVVICLVPPVPEYPGGMEEFYRFLKENIVYPDSAKAKGISGTVYVGFEVDTMGNVVNVKLQRGMQDCSECNEEALRVVRMMPVWKPGYLKDNPKNTHYTLPVRFVPPSQKKKQE